MWFDLNPPIVWDGLTTIVMDLSVENPIPGTGGGLLPPALGAPLQAATELATYLCESFGNAQRIDYGSGHELHFVCWLTALHRLGVLTLADHTAIGLVIFPKYLELTRALQTVVQNASSRAASVVHRPICEKPVMPASRVP